MTDIPKTGFPVIDIAVVLVIALSVASPFAVKTYRAIQELRKDMLSVKHQVKNDHGSNLRDDLDKTTEITSEGWKAVQVTLADIQDKLKNVALYFGGLRSEMRHERDKTDDINKRVHALEMKTEVAKQVKAEVDRKVNPQPNTAATVLPIVINTTATENSGGGTVTPTHTYE
nr:MAG TPA: Protein of unknown function (DUF2746) [Caudoviricetes sp.]